MRQKEKEAKKIEEKATKRQEKEAAKLEKMYRNTISSRSQISRSSERVGSRSGSLERRRSGDGEMVVLNQSTVHGNFSNASVPLLHGHFKMFSRVHRSRTVCVIFSTFALQCISVTFYLFFLEFCFFKELLVQTVDLQSSMCSGHVRSPILKRKTRTVRKRSGLIAIIVAVVEVHIAVPVA